MSSYNNDEDILLLAALCGATVAVKAITENLETRKKKRKQKKGNLGKGMVSPKTKSMSLQSHLEQSSLDRSREF